MIELGEWKNIWNEWGGHGVISKKPEGPLDMLFVG